MRKYNLTLIGSAALLFSFYLAVVHSFNHFYELTLTGLFIIIYPWITDKIKNKTYRRLFLIFIPGGLIADLLLGIYVTELWYYTYNSLWEYILLYLWIYPVGGIVMVQSYLLFERLIIEDIGETTSQKRRFIILLTSLLAILFTAISILYNAETAGLYTFISFLVLVLFNSQSIVRWSRKIMTTFGLKKELNRLTALEVFSRKPAKYIGIILASSYIQAVIHEVPNVYGQQWIYQNMPFQELTLLGVPAVVIIFGWIGLTLIPVSIYYRIADESSLKI